MSDPKQVQQRLMRLAREVDGLTWADRKCIGEAIALIDASQPPQDERCPTCGENEPHTGTCGTSDDDTRAFCKRRPVALSTLTDEQILHRWDAYVGEPTPKRPLTDADKLAFARAILAASTPAQQATPPQPVAAEVVLPMICRCFDETARRLCADKRKCAQVIAAALSGTGSDGRKKGEAK